MKQTCRVWKWCIPLAGILSAPLAAAYENQADYLKALKIAEQKVLKHKTLDQGRANALTVSPVTSLLGRSYRVGDSWDVAAWRSHSAMMRKTGDPDQLKSRQGELGIFRFRITEIRNQSNGAPKAILSVSRLQGEAARAMTFTLDNETGETARTRPPREKGKGAPPPSPLDLFPLDLPEVLTAERSAPQKSPELPTELQGFAFRPDLGRSAWFEQDDFFGRPVEILWQQGDPWPAYLKTPQGVAILLREGGTPR